MHAEPPLLEAQRARDEENLHEKAKEILKKVGISQAQMARELGISATTLQQWISSKYIAAKSAARPTCTPLPANGEGSVKRFRFKIKPEEPARSPSKWLPKPLGAALSRPRQGQGGG